MEEAALAAPAASAAAAAAAAGQRQLWCCPFRRVADTSAECRPGRLWARAHVAQRSAAQRRTALMRSKKSFERWAPAMVAAAVQKAEGGLVP